MASPAQKYRFSGLAELTPENIEQLDESLEDLYTYLTQSPFGTSDAAFDWSEIIEDGIQYGDDGSLEALDTVGSVYVGTDGLPASLSAATGNALISGGVSAVPSFGKIGLTTHVSGILPIANGGTNKDSFTTGSVLYFDGTRLQEDNAGLFFDAANDRLGVGIASPTNALDVRGTSPILAGYHSDTAGFSALRLFEGTTLRASVQHIGTTFATVGRRDDLELVTLQATGDVAIRPNDTETARFLVGGGLQVTELTTGSVLFAAASGRISQDNANLFWDDTNNRLGVGTALPTSPITVIDTAGGIYAPIEVHSAFASGLALFTHSDTVARAPAVDFYRSDNTQSSPQAIESGDTLGYLTFYGYGTTDYKTSAGISVVAAENFSDTNFGSYIQFNTKSLSGGAYQERMRVNGSGILTVFGSSASDTAISVGTLGDGFYSPGVGQLVIASNGSTAVTFATNQNATFASSIYIGATKYFGVNGRSLISSPADKQFVFSDNSGSGGPVTLAIGTGSFPSTGTNGLIFADGIALATMGTNTAGFYADDVGGTVEMFGIGEAGNVSQLTGLNIRKTADESVTNSTVHQADDHLTVNLAASSSYAFEIYGFWTTAGATAGITVQLDGTVGISSLKADVIHYENSADTYTISRITAFNSAVGQADTGDNSFCIKGVIETSTAGTLLLEWAQNAADAVNATTLQENSYFLLRKLNA